jgi:hypothetical protein
MIFLAAGNWLPGSTQPAWIPESTVGSVLREPALQRGGKRGRANVPTHYRAPCLLTFLSSATSCRTYGFDPLGLAKDKASLERFQEAEVIHCRWAMLGVAGVLGVEVLGFGNWYDAPTWVSNEARLRTVAVLDLKAKVTVAQPV